MNVQIPSTKRIISQITKPYDDESPNGNELQFDRDVLEYCQILRTTNNSKIE